MLNNTVLVGRLVRNPELKETENGKKVLSATLAVPRSFKNLEGEYETDFINVDIWNQVAENTAEYCKKGDLIGIKGRLESDSFEKDGKKEYRMKVVAERVTFLSQKRETKSNDNRIER